MDYRRANRAYMYMILSTVGLVVVLSLWYLNGGPAISILMNNILSESVVLLPAVAAVLYSGEKLSVLIPLRKIKGETVILTLIYVASLFPLVTLVNAISMLFVENTVTALSDDVLAMPVWVMILAIGIVGPFVEEIVFRGVILQSFQRTGRIIGSIILSSIMFGMMHMNFNQFAYGAVMGIMLALLVEATGSVLTSFIAHATFNTVEVVMLFALGEGDYEASELAAEYLENFGNVASNLVYYGYLVISAVIFTVVAFVLVRQIAKVEGRIEFFDYIPKSPKGGFRLITFPLVIAMAVSIAYMFFYTLI